jgi:elongation factor Ts
MPEITAKDVQALRQATGAGMMDAKRALVECGGDFEAATNWLREKGLAASLKRADRESAEGAVAVAVEGNAAAIVELRCETDFVAKSADFVNLVGELAQLVAAKGESAADERRDEIAALGATMKENVTLGRVVRFEAPEGALLDTYVHVQNDRGVIGVIVELLGGSRELAHDVALHVASAAPRYLRRDDVPAEEVERERAVLENLTRNEGKPEQAIPKIVEGRLNAFFREICLLEQPFVKDPKRSVADVLGGATVTRFARVQVGSQGR